MVVWSLCVVSLLGLFRALLRALIVLVRVLLIKLLEIVYRANTFCGGFDYSLWFLGFLGNICSFSGFP